MRREYVVNQLTEVHVEVFKIVIQSIKDDI